MPALANPASAAKKRLVRQRIQDRARLAGGSDNRWEVNSRHYLAKLSELVAGLGLEDELDCTLDVRQLFNGAALQVGGVPCASLSPVGLAFRLPPAEVAALIRGGRAIPLKYFAKGGVRKSWALFENPQLETGARLKDYFLRAIAGAGSRA